MEGTSDDKGNKESLQIAELEITNRLEIGKEELGLITHSFSPPAPYHTAPRSPLSPFLPISFLSLFFLLAFAGQQ